MSSAESAPVPPRTGRVNLGAIALGLVLGVLVLGIGALFVDGGASGADPFDTDLWPVHPLVIVVVMIIGLTLALVLGIRAIATKQGRDLGAAAIVVGMLPELLCLAIVVGAILNAIT